MSLASGTRLGPYEVLSVLGSGGMGDVYRARDTRLGREVAVKVLPEEYANQPERLRRFEGEARAASALSDPHIVTVFDVGEENGIHYFASELVEGSDLRHLLADGAVPLRRAMDLAGQIASGLAAAHDKGIVHRDLKPENVLITKTGLAKIADFGLAKLTESGAEKLSRFPTSDGRQTTAGVILGTVAYMSPEQVRGEVLDHRSDIFSFGVVLYELLTGHKAFERGSAAETMAAILKEEPPEVLGWGKSVPPALGRVVAHCLEKNPAQRFHSLRDVAFALEEARSQLTASAPTSLPATARGARLAGNGGRWIGWAAAAVVLLAAAAAFFLFARRAPALTEKDTILLADIVNSTGDPVFDGTLKQALATTLGQSPYLNIFPDTQVRETLRYMNRSPEERISRELGREICERRGLKAMLLGSISSLGSHYVIALEASNARTGDALDREQAEAPGKEQVLAAVEQAATRLRKHLGESLASIQKFDTPLTQATTSSLEALKAYTLARQEVSAGRALESIPLFQRAVELDPNFAAAYNGLAVAYFNSGDHGESARWAAKAFELRDRVTERERVTIATIYYMNVTGDLDKWIETAELGTRIYPRELSPRNNLAYGYLLAGQYEKAVEQASEGLRIDPGVATLYSNLGWAFRALGRYDEAKATFEKARARNLDFPMIHYNLYLIAFVQRDQASMKAEIQGAAGKPTESPLLERQSSAELFAGRFRQAEETVRQAVDRDELHRAAGILGRAAAAYAFAGDCQRARRDVASADKARGARRLDDQDSIGDVAVASALCGDPARAESIAVELTSGKPSATATNALVVPIVRALIQTDRGNAAGAIALLQKARRYEMGQNRSFWPQYVRGQAYLRQGSPGEAASEFQAILDHRSVSPANILYSLAHLGLARAAALGGDQAKSRRAYQDFFALWKDADSDIPILQQARREYQP